ncbi:MAG TPA: hypothetical protein VE934_02305 [Polaromonas sp.]|uniref:hypothetical protein n=1 Tax=Polaromonas sp. TaxID=1869339 RepID=UPI002D32E60D|nr:hypothetical protein [Polaromonas sp.]HYW55766.1 hypothetical protein [Polaromonas sp.]
MNAQDETLVSSRPMGVAGELGAKALEPAIVFGRQVILTGELASLREQNGRWCFLDSLRLLSRVVGDLTVVLPDERGDFHLEVDEVVAELWSQGRVRRIGAKDCDFLGATAILNVGNTVRPDLPWTSINANGWIARCTSGSKPLPEGSAIANPLACMLAASFGVAEVFKRIYGVPPHKAAPMKDVAFSLFELSVEFTDFGPRLPDSISLPNTLLLGAGAIGNGIVLLSSQLPLLGRMLVLDKQVFGPENYATCALLDVADWIGKPKAKRLAGWLTTRSCLAVTGEQATVQSAMDDGLLDGLRPDLVINGLDDIGARKAVQKVWPSLLVDGGINSVGAAVRAHSMSHRHLACMRCAFVDPVQDHIDAQSRVTGLARASLEGNQDRPITDEDIAHASSERREWLRAQQRQGRTVCSTMNLAQAEGLGLALEEGFQPSVPFVATASAALVMAHVLRTLLWPQMKFFSGFQFESVFAGADTAQRYNKLASPGCECTRNKVIIDTILARRDAAACKAR